MQLVVAMMVELFDSFAVVDSFAAVVVVENVAVAELFQMEHSFRSISPQFQHSFRSISPQFQHSFNIK
jgi:hypothetical protein